MVERATCAASREQGFRDGVELLTRSAPADNWFERVTTLNHLVAGWGLLLLALLLNVLDLGTPGRDHLAFLGVVCSGLALFCVWCGMLAKSTAMRAAWFVWNASAIVVAFVAWLFNHRDLWGIFRNVLS